METPTKRFSIICSFLGFGDPNAPIWFVGLEEAGEWDKDPEKDAEMYRKYATGYFSLLPGAIASEAQEYGRHFTKIYDIMSKLVVCALNDPQFTDWKYYRDTYLFTKGGHTFQANLYPLGKPSLCSWPEQYHSLFGVESSEAYYKSILQYRLDLLKSAYEKYKPRVTICFGKSGWGGYQKAFGLGRDPGEEIDGCCFLSSNVILTPFFSYRVMPQKRIDRLGHRISRILLE